MLDRTDAESRREALGLLRPRLVLVVAESSSPVSPSPRPRRSGPTCSNGSARRHDVATLLTRPGRAGGRGRRWRRRPPSSSPSGSGSPSCSRTGPRPGSTSAPRQWSSAPTGCSSRDELLAERSWLNVHPSLLPRWRGAAPVERAIMAGDDETGVTIHETVAELDAGPVAAQGGVPDRRRRTTPATCTRGRREVAARLLDGVLDEPEPALHAAGRGADVRRRRSGAEDRRLDLAAGGGAGARRAGAQPAHRRTRGARGPPVTVWRARVGDDGSFEPLEVQPDGGRRMPAEAWRRGLR